MASIANHKRRFQQKHQSSSDLWVRAADEEGEEVGYDDISISINTAQIKENKKFINSLETWGATTKAKSITGTGKGIARLVEKIAQDGRVTIDDESLILEAINAQRGWWSTLVLMDTLVILFGTTQLNFANPSDNGHWSEEAGKRLLFAYHALLAGLLYFTVIHMMMLLLLSGLTSYIFEVKGILTFFVRCHTLLVHVNFSGFLFQLPGMCFVPVIAQTYSFGLLHALPALVFCCIATSGFFVIYGKVIKPLFIGLYNEEYNIGSYADLETEKTGEMEEP